MSKPPQDELTEARRLAQLPPDNRLRVVMLTPCVDGKHRVYLASCLGKVFAVQASAFDLSRPSRLLQQVARQRGFFGRHGSQGNSPRVTALRWAEEIAQAQARFEN